MLLDDAEKIRAAKKLKEGQGSVTGIMVTEEGIKEVAVSLSDKGLEIIPKVKRKIKVTRKPRKTKTKKGK